jgi:hypothetical protein
MKSGQCYLRIHRLTTGLLMLLPVLLLCAGILPAQADSSPAVLLPNWVVDGVEQGADFGIRVAAAGDVNGDGFDDVLIGADRASDLVYRAGCVYLHLGGPGGLGYEPAWLTCGTANGDRYGSAIAGRGDLNGDGYDDLAVGAYRFSSDKAEADEGIVFVYYGGPTGPAAQPDWVMEGNQKGAEFGYGLSMAGDVNGDGFDDLLVGMRYYDNDIEGQTRENAGQLLLYYGSTDGLAAAPGWTFASEQPAASLGYAVSGGMDINRDGYADLLGSAPFYDHGQEDEGAVFLFFGSPDGPGSQPDWWAEGNQIHAEFGMSACLAGDTNADGYADVLIGAPGATNLFGGIGIAYLFLGHAAGPGIYPDWQNGLPPSETATAYGSTVSPAGDFNDDGYADLLIGAYLYTHDQQAEGAFFIHLGGSDGPEPAPEWWDEGNKANTWFGWSAATAGDINADGRSDLIVGAPEYFLGTDPLGRVYVYHGRLEGETTYQLHFAMIQLNPQE